MNKLLVIIGPTATGKTDLALQLARKFEGELVSVDSRQIYVGLDIGTGKMPGGGKWKIRRGKGFWEINGMSKARAGALKIWLYDVLNPKKQYTVANYIKDANKVITEIRKRGRLPIIVGGTGLYLKALLSGLSNLSIPVDLKLRKKLQALPLKDLQDKLQKISSQKWEKMNSSDRQNTRRLIRAIELEVVGNKDNKGNGGDQGLVKKFDVLKIGLTASRDVLYQGSDERAIKRINQGMIDEAKMLHKKGLSLERMRQLGLEYGVLADYLDGKILRLDDSIKILQNKIHSFIRRQLTWFKREKAVNWFDIADENFPDNVEKIIAKWYHQPDDTKNRYIS